MILLLIFTPNSRVLRHDKLVLYHSKSLVSCLIDAGLLIKDFETEVFAKMEQNIVVMIHT